MISARTRPDTAPDSTRGIGRGYAGTMMSRPALLLILLPLCLWGCGLWGCGRHKSAHRPAATPEAAGVAQPSGTQTGGTQTGSARTTAAAAGAGLAVDPAQPPSADADPETLRLAATRGAVMGRPGAFDVLVAAAGPIADATRLDAAIAPIIAALRRLPDVQRVWSRTEAGMVRVVVRCGATRTAAQAERLVRATWAAASLTELTDPSVYAIAPGQRAVAAFTVIANAGPREATRLLAEKINPAARALPDVARVWTAGAVHPYHVVRWMPPYLARHKIGIAEAQRRLEQALVTGRGTLAKRLDAAPLPVAPGRPSADKKVTLADLVVSTTGLGEPTTRAYTGNRVIVSTVVEAGSQTPGNRLSGQLATEIAHKRLRQLPKTVEHFHHALTAMERYRLIQKQPAAPDADRAFRGQLASLGKARMFHDIFVLGGEDGVPAHMQDHATDGQVWTMWLAVGAGVRQEEVYQTLAERLPDWRVVPIADEHDTALNWLARPGTTASVVFASNDAVLLTRATTALTRELAAERRIGLRRSGPHRSRTGAPFGMTRRDVARARGVAAADLALATQLNVGLRYAGNVDGVAVWTGLPTGVMSTRQGELPLAAGTSLIAWQEVLQLRDDSQDTPRLRIDGLPALWYGADPREDAAGEFARAFWMAVEQRIEPSRRLDVRSLITGQRPLSQALRAP